MVNLVKGSIFDTKCDLIIIPCNNLGEVSPGVLENLMTKDLPYFHQELEAGDIAFTENIGRFANASAVGYAASVNVYAAKTTPEMLESISKKIIAYCRKNQLRRVNIPLLGTGAGGMDEKTSYRVLKKAFLEEAFLDVTLYVYAEGQYRNIENQRQVEKTLPDVPIPRVFISYTATDPQNKKWVVSFASKLRENGVDARIDEFHLRGGVDLAQWMTNEVQMADKVLLICDKYYAAKANAGTGGVGWETMIIQGDMLSNPNKAKYIAIVRNTNIDESLPIYMRSKYAFVWPDEETATYGFQNLLLCLFNCDLKPPVGSPPKYIRNALGLS